MGESSKASRRADNVQPQFVSAIGEIADYTDGEYVSAARQVMQGQACSARRHST